MAQDYQPWTEEAPVLDYESTTALLHELDLVDGPPEDVFDKFTRLVAGTTGAPVALVSFIEEGADRQYFKSALGLAEPWASRRQTPLSHSFCRHVKQTDQMLEIEDARCHPLVRDNLAIADLGVIAYLGAPIRDQFLRPVGSICAIDVAPRAWARADRDVLRDLAACVSDQICLRAALHFR